jgi:predicted NBD/HSP70 family sugar kinase/GH43 family beta-xylosidase
VKNVLALDIGGTWLRASAGGEPAQARTPENGADALASTLELADTVVAGGLDAVGVSFGGRVHGDDVLSLHVPGWEDVGLVAALHEHYGAPVSMANDANAGALAEWDAAGRPGEPCAYITVSTGVGGGVVVGGEILAGAHGLAGEIGHLVVDPNGEECACGQRGCVETIASGPALAGHGDYAAAARALTVAVEALRAVVDPAFVAIGGGVATAPQLWEALAGAGARRARSTPLHGARVLALLVLAVLLAGCGGGASKTFRNPVYSRDFPDPFVLQVGGTYYAYATNGNGANVQTATSKDLVHWTPGPDALPKLGSWDFPGSTWAPEVAARADGTYVLYYTASSGTQCIGRAVATSPQGPFVDRFDGPLVCQKSDGGSIDPDPSGSYLYWKNDGNSIGRTTHIWAQRLSSDGLRLVGAAHVVETNDAVWEANVVEGPEMVVHDGRHYLFYSGGHYNEDNYAVGYATCTGPLGPCADAPENPILQTACRAHGPGHNTFAQVGDQTWIVYHAWLPNHAGNKRVLWIDRLDWKDRKPVVHGPTCTTQKQP